MSTLETGIGGISFALTDEQRSCARSRGSSPRRRSARGSRVRRAADASRRGDREGTRGRADEPAHPGRARRARASRRSTGMLIGEELSWGCAGHRASRSSATRSASAPVLLAGSDEQKRQWLPPLLEEPILCSFAPDRARRRLGRRPHQDDCRARRRRVRPQRLEDVHHERGSRRVVGRLRLDRPRRRAIAGSRRSSSRWTATG